MRPGLRCRPTATMLAAALLVGALGGCSGSSTDAGGAGTTSASPTSADATGDLTSPPDVTSPATSTAAATPIPTPTTMVPVDKVIKDPDLGHEIKVLRMARDLPWPDPASAESQAFELVGVEMTWTPGVTYTASLRTVDFSIASGTAYPNRPDAVINPNLQAAGWTMLPAELPNGQTATGWLVFKVDPKDAASLRLDYTRPASRVTDSGQTFPKTVFSAQLAG